MESIFNVYGDLDLQNFPIVAVIEDVDLATDDDEQDARNGVLGYNVVEKKYCFYDMKTREKFYWVSTFKYSTEEVEKVNKYFGWENEPASACEITHRDIWFSGVSQKFVINKIVSQNQNRICCCDKRNQWG